jgi:hypothetical protein
MLRRGAFLRLISIWLAWSLALPNYLAGQQRRAVADWQRVCNLAPGTSIAVKTKARASYHGDLIGSNGESLILDSDERGFPGRTRRRRDLRRDDVLEVRRFSSGLSGLAGMGIGAAAGASIGLAIDLSARSNEDKGLATAILTLLGGLLGWAVGRHTSLVKGEVVYRAP